ncbi:MAG: hypothetical protein ACE5JX_07635 [Acidobacteriota bacterium]
MKAPQPPRTPGIWMCTALATLTCLLPYLFSAASALLIGFRDSERPKGKRLVGPSIIAGLAFVYSFFAISGTGRDTVYGGFSC